MMDTYEEKYKGALARCKWLLSEGMISRIAATDLFRELMDNDSENIRKVIINIFHSLADGKIPVDINYADIFTWLEKQDNANKEYWRGYREGKKEILDKYSELEKQNEQKPAIEMVTPEESLGIDSETYKKIVDECIYGDDKQKLDWTEEDKRILDALITSLINERFAGHLEFLKGIKVSSVIDWLKSLKEKGSKSFLG